MSLPEDNDLLRERLEDDLVALRSEDDLVRLPPLGSDRLGGGLEVTPLLSHARGGDRRTCRPT
jgi:hypothetical protein